MVNDPEVSVVMPAFNAGAFIDQAIQSIRSQSFSDFELIVVDDGSDDSTATIVENHRLRDGRIRLLRNESNLNIGVSLNRALDAAHGRYVARMDADDWSYPARLATQVAFMDEHPAVAISGGAMEVCDGTLKPLNVRSYHLTDAAIRRRLFRYSPFSSSATFFRRELAIDVGGFDPRFAVAGAEDYDFYFRIGLKGEFANVPDVLIRLRTHSRSISQTRGREQERLTLQIRRRARDQYGYPMSVSDRLYSRRQAASMFVLPARAKFWLFNRLRRAP